MKVKGIFLCNNPGATNQVWGKAQRTRLREHLDVSDRIVNASDLPEMREELKDVEVAFSTWGMPHLTSAELNLLPNLKAVFYAAGSVKAFAPPLLERNITITSAWKANAIPVAEYTLSQILFALKSGWQHVRHVREHPGPSGWTRLKASGAFGSTVGIASLGQIGQKVCELLSPFDVKRLAYDPYVSEETARRLNLEMVSLAELFKRSDVVTLHVPWLKVTDGLITGALVSSMKPNATLINTARGAIIREDELVQALRLRSDLTAILDVPHPEPPAENSPLYSLPNLILTPHIAGSMGDEVQRMAEWMVDEFISWKSGKPLRYAITQKMMETMA